MADEESRDWTWRIERAGQLAPGDVAPGENDGLYPSSAWCFVRRRHCRFVIEKPLVHRSELLDTQIAIGHAFAAAAGRSGRRQCEHDVAHVCVRQRPSFEQRRAAGCEEAAVECGDTQIPGVAPMVREARNGLKGLPEPVWLARRLGRGAQRFHRVGVPVHGMPCRHQAASLGKTQEQDAVDGGECLLVKHPGWRGVPAMTAFCEGRQQALDRLVHPVAQGCADSLPVRVRSRHHGRERRARTGGCGRTDTRGGSQHD